MWSFQLLNKAYNAFCFPVIFDKCWAIWLSLQEWFLNLLAWKCIFVTNPQWTNEIWITFMLVSSLWELFCLWCSLCKSGYTCHVDQALMIELFLKNYIVSCARKKTPKKLLWFLVLDCYEYKGKLKGNQFWNLWSHKQLYHNLESLSPFTHFFTNKCLATAFASIDFAFNYLTVPY